MNKKVIKIKHSLFKTVSKLLIMNKIFLGVLVNIFITSFSYSFTSFLLDIEFNFIVFSIILIPRIFLPFFFFNDYKLSWSKASVSTAYLKFFINSISFILCFVLRENVAN